MGSTTKIKEKLKNREKVLCTYMGDVASPFFAEAYGNSGVDCVIVDMEHGSFNPEMIGDFAVECNKHEFPVIARIQDCEYHCISKCIDQGCDGILVPRTETLTQLETAIASIRLFPKGRKGVGGRACLRGETVEEFNENRLIFIQIESPLGVKNLDEMLTRHGDEIAGIIIGPCDLSIMCGCPLDFEAKPFLDCVYKTIEICQAHQKSVGMFMGTMEIARNWYKEGMNIFWHGGETACLELGLKSLAHTVSEF